MKEEQRNTLVHAINHFGVEGQVNKAVEEMGELITELSRRNLPRFDREHVAEEVADALIMLEPSSGPRRWTAMSPGSWNAWKRRSTATGSGRSA